jgi:diguanylate cyclase (GGDEF)-like protein
MVDDDDESWEDTEDRTMAVALTPTLLGQDEQKAYLIVLSGTNVGEMYNVTDEMLLGRGNDVAVRVRGDAVSRRHARITVSGTGITIEDLGSTNGTFVNGEKISRTPLTDGDKIQIGTSTILKFTYHDRLEEHFQKELYDSALRDGLTKIFNKKHFLERIKEEFAFAVRHGADLSLLMFDLDHFKQLNDGHGHVAGDHVLSTLASAIGRTVRGEDLFARYGGEEFVILCRSTSAEQAAILADRLRATVQRTDFTFQGQPLRVTISLGVATVPDRGITTPSDFVQAADDALYEAKNAGRDRIVLRPQHR